MFNWKWYYNLPSLLLWVVLLGAIIFIKENHNRRVLLILIPILIVHLIWYGLLKLLNAPSSAGVQMGTLITSYTIGLAVLWLLAYKIGNRNRIVTFLLALGIVTGLALIGYISYSGLEFSLQGISIFLIQFIMTCAILLGIVLAGWRCRNRYSGLRFMIFLAFWTLIACLVGVIVFYFILLTIQGASSIQFSTILLAASISGLILGLFSYLINFPFMILGFVNPFFRKRFYACLNLKSMPSIAESDSNTLEEKM